MKGLGSVWVGVHSILYKMVREILPYEVNFEQDLKEEKKGSCKSLQKDYSKRAEIARAKALGQELACHVSESRSQCDQNKWDE